MVSQWKQNEQLLKGNWNVSRGYTKEFLIDAYMSRFIKSKVVAIDVLVELEQNAIKLYDRVGKDEFRTYASLDAKAIKEFRANAV